MEQGVGEEEDGHDDGLGLGVEQGAELVVKGAEGAPERPDREDDEVGGKEGVPEPGEEQEGVAEGLLAGERSGGHGGR